MFLSDSLSTAVLPAVATGLVTCLALLSSLGAQNLLLLRHGLRRDRTGLVVGIFLASDIVLVIAGVAGLAGALSAAPAVRGALSVGGAVFLLWLAYGAARRALRPAPMPAATVTVPVGAPAAPAGEERPDAPQWPWAGEPVHHDPWWVVAAAAVAVTWLNPQVLLETALPKLSAKQRRELMVKSALSAGYPLGGPGADQAFWQRLDLDAAYAQAKSHR